MAIPNDILEAIDVTRQYFGTEDNWVTFKKEVMKQIRSSSRKNFSTRDPKTKKQSLNDFEKEVIEHWFKLTGVKLIIKG